MGETLKLFKIIWKSYCTISNIYIVTARKRSLRRLCFYTCLSVHGGEYLGRYTPPGQVHSRAGTPPGRYTPRAGTPPWAGTPPTTVHAAIRSISGRYASHWNAFLFVGFFCSGSLCFRICSFFLVTSAVFDGALGLTNHHIVVNSIVVLSHGTS